MIFFPVIYTMRDVIVSHMHLSMEPCIGLLAEWMTKDFNILFWCSIWVMTYSVKYCCHQNFQLPMNMGSASIYWYVSIYGNFITYIYEKPYIGQDGHDSHHFILWVMKEYGVTSSWTQYFTDDGEYGKVIPRPICFRRNGDIVFVSSVRQFVSWNCESKEFKILGWLDITILLSILMLRV